MSLVAGSAQVEITPPPGVALMGYGARQGNATAVHDPLFARALFLDSGGADHSLLLISADLCLIAPEQALQIRTRVAAETRLAPSQIAVACTHTHSGPDTGVFARSAGKPEPPHVTDLFARLVEAGVRAAANAAPATLRLERAEARIGRNRRLADGPLDPEIAILAVDHADGRPLAVVFQHACHGTVLGHDNLEVSADWAGYACGRIGRETGACAIFVLGAHADIDPRTRGLMDLAIPGQSIGLDFEAARVLGEEVAEAVLGALSADRAGEREVRCAAASTPLELPLHLGDPDSVAVRRELASRKEWLASQLGVSIADFPRLSQLGARAWARARELPLSEARRLHERVRLYLRDRTARFFVGGAHVATVEVQVLQMGGALFLGLPLEPTTEVGLDWKRRMADCAELSGVIGIANGWLRYLPHALDLQHPQANQHYEVLESILAPGACERLLDQGERLVDGLLAS
jgi:hypothetical protein